LRPGSDFLEGWIDEGLGRDDQAIDLYARHLRYHPEDVVTRERRVALLAQHDRVDEAWREATLVRKARPHDPATVEAEADLAFRAHHESEGRAGLEMLRKLDADDPQLVWRSAVVLQRHHQSAEGVTIASTWARARPADSRGAMLMARVYTLNGDTLRA